MAKLEVEKLRKRFGSVVAVDGVSFHVDAGEVLVLLGPSGCGKTTVLRCIAGLEQPDHGEIRVDGRSIAHLPPEKRDVGLVFQNYALFPHLTVAENVAYGVRHGRHRLPRQGRRERVAELLELVGLSGYARRKPHELSEGQKQRVALARALAVEPKVLLLDEPLSALDAVLRVELRQELRRILKERGTTAVYVTHDQEEALSLGERVGVMREGRLEQVGRPEEVYERPRTPFVAQFLGRANLWPARIVRPGKITAFVEVAGTPWEAAVLGPLSSDEGLLFFRPEWVELGSGPFLAEVEEAEYLGDHWEVRGKVQDFPVILCTLAKPGNSLRFQITRSFILPED